MRWCGHAAVYIGDAAYTAVPDCPRRAIPCFDLTITDRFWRRKIDTNAGVSIPLEVRKLTETPRGLIGNVLEAAILSLRTHPNRQLQAMVDEPIGELRREQRSGNSAFEVAAASYMTTGRRDLLDNAAASAARLYDKFATADPPSSGGERDAIKLAAEHFRLLGDVRRPDVHHLEPSPVLRDRHGQYVDVLERGL